MTDTLFDPEFATKAIAPSGDIAIDDGSVPTWIVVTWLFVSRSKTTTFAAVADVAPLVLVDGDGVALALVAPAAAVVGEAAVAALGVVVPAALVVAAALGDALAAVVAAALGVAAADVAPLVLGVIVALAPVAPELVPAVPIEPATMKA